MVEKIVAKKKVFRPFQNSNFCLLYFGFFAAETVFWSFLWMIFVNLVEIDNFIKIIFCGSFWGWILG